MNADLRGFRHELAPLAQLEASRLQMAELELSRVAARCTQAAEMLEGSRVAVRQFVAEVGSHGGERVDLAFRQLATRYVVDLNRAVERLEARVATLQRERAQAFEHWDGCRRRVEQLDRHRDAARGDFAREAAARQFAQADDDWIMRRDRREEADAD